MAFWFPRSFTLDLEFSHSLSWLVIKCFSLIHPSICLYSLQFLSTCQAHTKINKIQSKPYVQWGVRQSSNFFCRPLATASSFLSLFLSFSSYHLLFTHSCLLMYSVSICSMPVTMLCGYNSKQDGVVVFLHCLCGLQLYC